MGGGQGGLHGSTLTVIYATAMMWGSMLVVILVISMICADFIELGPLLVVLMFLGCGGFGLRFLILDVLFWIGFA